MAAQASEWIHLGQYKDINFLFGQQPPADEDLFFASFDPQSGPGTLNQYMSEATGLSLPDWSPGEAGEVLVAQGEGRHLVLIATVGPSASTQELIRNNLSGFLLGLDYAKLIDGQDHPRHFLPLIGTGHAGLDFAQSARAIISAIVSAGFMAETSKGGRPLRGDFFLSGPQEGLDPDRLGEIARELQDHLQQLMDGEADIDSFASDPPEPDEIEIAVDSTRFQSDRPVESLNEDLLGRSKIARAIYQNVNHIWEDQAAACEPFIVHVAGRWGSGKSSILNFLKKMLQPENPKKAGCPGPEGERNFLIVNYNAWQLQEKGSAWWTLLNVITRDLASQMPWPRRWLFRLGDLWWRFFTGWWNYVLLLIVAAGVGLLVYATVADTGRKSTIIETTVVEDKEPGQFRDSSEGEKTRRETTSTVVQAPSKGLWETVHQGLTQVHGTLTLLAGIAGLFAQVFARRMRTRQVIESLSSDPTLPLRQRFEKIIRRQCQPVAIFIDDLDRCSEAFVVELLQGLQTVFAGCAVLYVVAADEDWIVSAYEQVYGDFSADIAFDGQPMGHLFVKKIFQLSARIPDLSQDTRSRYLRALSTTALPEASSGDERAAEVDDFKDRIRRSGGNTGQIRVIMAEAETAGVRDALTQTATDALFSEAAQDTTRNEIMEFEEYFDSNPRSIKLILNALRFRQVVGILSRNEANDPNLTDILPMSAITNEHLIRWSILQMRFPYAAKVLSRNPDFLSEAGWSDAPDAKYFTDPAAIARILGPISPAILRTLRRFS